MARRLDDAGVLVHLATNQVFEVNDSGMRIWELLSAGVPPTDVPDRLAAEFTVSRDEAAGEVATLIERFRAQGLLT